MLTSRCGGSVFVALAVAGLAWGQGTPQARTTPVVTIREMDGPAQKCRLIQSWGLEGGRKASRVQVLDTGEMLTIVETGPASTPGATGRTADFYHWGLSDTPPPGVPLPPGESPVRKAAPVRTVLP